MQCNALEGPERPARDDGPVCNREVGAGGSYPGYRNPHNAAHMRELCELWNIDFATFHHELPRDILTMMEMAERGEVEFLMGHQHEPAGEPS